MDQPSNLNTPGKPQPLLLGLAIFCLLLWTGLLLWQASVHMPTDFKIFPDAFNFSRYGALQPKLFFSHWLGTFKIYLLWLGFGVGALGTGWSLLDWFFPAVRSRLEKAVLSFALGFAALSLATFLLGIAGGYYTPVYATLYALFVSWGAWNVWQQRAELKPAPGWLLGKQPLLEERVLAVMVLLVVAMQCLAANTPELFFDALNDHLGVPAQWIQHHGIISIPTIFTSFFPKNIEMLYTGALFLADERLCRLLHVSMGLLGTLAVFALGRRWFGRRVGLWGTGFFITIPMVIYFGAVSGVDVGTFFFTTAALLALFHAFLSEPPATRQVVLAGVLIGAALSCKYTALFILAPAILAAFSAAAFRRTAGVKTLGWSALKLGAGVLVCLLPWLIKNAVLTGNPVYPFFYEHIPSQYLQLEKMQSQMAIYQEIYQRSWIQYLCIPWNSSLKNHLGPIFLFFIPGFFWLGLTARRRPLVTNVFFGTAFLMMVFWSLVTQSTRYLISGFSVLAVLSAVILLRAEEWSKLFGRCVRLSTLGIMAWGFITAGGLIFGWDPLGVALGLQARDVYLEKHMLTGYYPMARIINGLPGKVQIFAFGDTRAYYIEKPMTTVFVYDANPLVQWLDRGPSAEAIWKQFRRQGYTHIFVHAQEAVRTRGFETYRWSPEAIARWQELLAHYTKRIALIQQQALYEILPEPNLQRSVKSEKPLYTYDPAIVSIVNPRADQALHLTQQGHWQEAEAEWRKILELAPGWNAPYLMLAIIYQQQQRFAEALTMYQHADSLTDLKPEEYYNMGVLYWSARKPLDAIRCMRRALEEAPGFEIARKSLASMEQMLPRSRKH